MTTAAAKTFYLKMKDGQQFQIEARDARDAKRIYRAAFNLRKMPGGSLIGTDRNCGYYNSSPFIPIDKDGVGS